MQTESAQNAARHMVPRFCIVHASKEFLLASPAWG